MKKIIKKIVESNFKSFAYFYKQIGPKIFLALTLSVVVGFLDGIGLTMFLPLIKLADSTGEVNPQELGKLSFVVDAIKETGLSLNLKTILLFLCIFFSLKGIAQYIRGRYQVILQQLFIKKIRLNLINLFNHVTYKYFVSSDAGRIQNTFSGEVDRVARAYQTYFNTFQSSILVVVYMSFAFFIDAQFAVLVTVGGALTNIVYKQIYKNTKGASKALTGQNHVFQSLLIQRVANFKYLKATGNETKFSDKLVDSVEIIEANNRKIGILSAILTATREPLLILVVASVIYVQIAILEAQLAPILISLLFFYKALNALMLVQTQWNLFIAVSGSLQNMTDFTNELKVNVETKGKETFKVFNNSISLSNVNFGYSTDNLILKEINLEIRKNETIAFVGESGSGKTTLINMIAGLMKNDSGVIAIDQTDIKMFDIHTYQNRIGYITQDPVIFNDTVFNNITFWDEPSPENIKKFNSAIEKASIKQFILEMEQKENSILGNSGINLSGGQKQRISIARELYKNIDILILDEATSALDSETEKLIQDNIEELKGNYTILIVAHRLSTIKNADRIVFMNKGKIEMVDDFNSLYLNSPSFNRMVKLQEL